MRPGGLSARRSSRNSLVLQRHHEDMLAVVGCACFDYSFRVLPPFPRLLLACESVEDGSIQPRLQERDAPGHVIVVQLLPRRPEHHRDLLVGLALLGVGHSGALCRATRRLRSQYQSQRRSPNQPRTHSYRTKRTIFMASRHEQNQIHLSGVPIQSSEPSFINATMYSLSTRIFLPLRGGA